MSKYTTEVRFICESMIGLKDSVGYNDTERVIAEAAPKIFNFPFPIYDEAYKPVLEAKILRHYYTREIAFETVGLWQLKLATKLNEIMPYYNKLYASELYTFNPLYDVDITKDHTGEKETNSSGSSTGHAEYSDTATTDRTTTDDGETWNYFQDTPQGGLTGIENLSYLTNATKNTGENTNTVDDTTSKEGENDSTTTTQENITDADSYIEHIVGSNGGQSYSAKILEFRKTLLNIDMMIIEDLKDLFFLLW